MERKPLTMLGAVALLVITGCKQDPPPAPAPTAPPPPRVSPVPNKPFTGQVKVAFPDLAVASPDAGAKAATKVAPPTPAPASDAGAAAAAAAAERKKTERSFDQVLAGAKGALKGCLDAGASGSGQAKLSIKLRSGAVVGSNVSGVPSSVGTCISNVLGSLRVRDPSGQSLTIERGIKYSEPQK